MNVFFLDANPRRAAQMHNDRHVVKMILESAQMLSTVCRQNGQDVGYKACFEHHPCTKWASQSLANWKWIRALALALDDEFKYRFENEESHKSAQVIRGLPEPPIEDKGLTEPAQAMPDYCKSDNPVEAYRTYYKKEKGHLAEWRKRGRPKFI